MYTEILHLEICLMLQSMESICKVLVQSISQHLLLKKKMPDRMQSMQNSFQNFFHSSRRHFIFFYLITQHIASEYMDVLVFKRKPLLELTHFHTQVFPLASISCHTKRLLCTIQFLVTLLMERQMNTQTSKPICIIYFQHSI